LGTALDGSLWGVFSVAIVLPALLVLVVVVVVVVVTVAVSKGRGS
jgi:hypothetical protein